MENKILEELDEEIARIQGRLKSMEPSSQEYDYMVEQLNKLHKLRMTEVKREDDLADQIVKAERDLIKESEEAERYEREEVQKAKDRRFDKIMRGVEVGVPLVFYGALAYFGFKFEETGAITSFTFKNFLGKMKPGKK